MPVLMKIELSVCVYTVYNGLMKPCLVVVVNCRMRVDVYILHVRFHICLFLDVMIFTFIFLKDAGSAGLARTTGSQISRLLVVSCISMG